MLLRQLVSQWLHQNVQHKFQEVVSEAVRGAEYRFGSPVSLKNPLPCDLVILFSLGVEAGGTVDRMRDQVTMRCPNFVEHTGTLDERRVAVIETGVGTTAAAAATADVVVLHRPSWVISAGFAGGLRADLRRGHMVMADEVVNLHQQCLSIGLHVDRASLAASPSLHVGRLLTVDHLVHSKAERLCLARDHQAIVCDMETFAIAEVCQREHVRFLSIRIISEALEEELPKGMERLLEQKSLAARLGAATGVLLSRPSGIKEMWKLKEDALKASDRLARFLAGVVAQLPPTPSAGELPPT